MKRTDRTSHVIGGPCSQSKDGHIAGLNGLCFFCAIPLFDAECVEPMTWKDRQKIVAAQDPVDPDLDEIYWEEQDW